MYLCRTALINVNLQIPDTFKTSSSLSGREFPSSSIFWQSWIVSVVVIQDALNRLIHQKGVTMKLLRTSPSLSLSINVRVLSTYHNFLPLYLRKVTLVTLISFISFWLRLHGRRIDTLYLRFRQRVVYGYHLTAIVSPQQTTKSRHRKRWWRKF